MLMHAHGRAVDHLHLAVVGFHDGVPSQMPSLRQRLTRL
jgi:hypothetical protein